MYDIMLYNTAVDMLEKRVSCQLLDSGRESQLFVKCRYRYFTVVFRRLGGAI